MAEIALVHWELYLKGGAEAVAMNILECLQDHHELTLITDEDVDIEDYNGIFNTKVDPQRVNIEVPRRAGIGPDIPIKLIQDHLGSGRFGLFFPSGFAWLNWLAEPLIQDVDLVINTKSMMAPKVPTIEYIHYPVFNPLNNPHSEAPKNVITSAINTAIQSFEGINRRSSPHLTLTNSEWTADIIKNTFDIEPRVVYPPVEVPNIPTESEDREAGFVTLGRISRDKNLERAIKIMDGVRRQGINTHLHIIGIESDSDYVRKIRKKAAEREYIIFEGEVSRDRLQKLLNEHKYGLHTKEREHFGIAVAEMVAAGVLPFVHASGGQVDIVNNNERLLYEDTEDAVHRISSLLTDEEMELKVRSRLPNISEKFGRYRFQEEFRKLTEEFIKDIGSNTTQPY